MSKYNTITRTVIYQIVNENENFDLRFDNDNMKSLNQ